MTRIIDFDTLEVHPGRAQPLGATPRPGGVRFAVFSRHAENMSLLLFHTPEDTGPAREIVFDPERHRIGDVWSVYVKGAVPGMLYAFRATGPFEPEQGHRFDASCHLLDPYAKSIVGAIESGLGKCVVVDEDEDWQDDVRPKTPMPESIIYETHVRGLTIHPSSAVSAPGTYHGLIEKLPYLRDLGVTAIELLPVQEIGEKGLGRCSLPLRKEPVNYWGYNSIGFFAPTGRYATRWEGSAPYLEFRDMVAAAHKHGLEVILDVVFNHTAEGNENGATLSFKGLDNAIYYMLDSEGNYHNHSGCGNTLNCNHPIVRDFIIDALRYWVTVMHIDGFRFDLASILGRDRQGRLISNAPLVEHIAEDPLLRDVKLIAEAWDAGGAYQVGSFGDMRWAEWNGRYRDDVRRFWRGDDGVVGDFATRITGSADLYQWDHRTPCHSVNFVTAHDGFTLCDLVSYNRKHNKMNGEDNRDGDDNNLSCNCGVEGETDRHDINALRRQMQKNYLATLFLSLGVPMMLGGDEFARTQKGNNNAYCQDNDVSWYNWELLEKNRDLFDFCKALIAFRKDNPVFNRNDFFAGKSVGDASNKDIEWLDTKGQLKDWEDVSPLLACLIDGSANDGTPLYLIFNGTGRDRRFRVPKYDWVERINTANNAPDDFRHEDNPAFISAGATVLVSKKSVVVLAGRAT